ncbi:hypothetical protein [Methylocucumis oryzae]|uniref:DUF1640 domain-containing protein n=1 Tax=Methylocucumis oryzae TaxID=1632867 RepID=A0A0F3IE04_9GAMM|nr:hypothetical protein [Methylocucumis oryzae]KJV04996.1 hypothetical protein VZ94_21335 [Methylocucumis oryzae]
MAVIAFDTLKFANTLKQAGVAPAHAEAEEHALADVLSLSLNEVATKADAEAHKTELHHVKTEVQAVKEDVQVIKQDGHILKSRCTHFKKMMYRYLKMTCKF